MDIRDSFAILDEAVRVQGAKRIVCLFSGGYDSAVATHVAMAWSRERRQWRVEVASIDTHVSADGWRDYVSDVANAQGWKHRIWDNPDPDWYYRDSALNGFPYTRAMHGRIVYRMLKERTIDKMRRQIKQYRSDSVLLVAGIRRAESLQRATAAEWQRDGLATWAHPLINWSDDDTSSYRLDAKLPLNPFYNWGAGSGDCQCNWGRFISLRVLRKYSPLLASRIEPADAACRAKYGYGYGEKPTKPAPDPAINKPEPIVNLCASCKDDARDEAAAFRELQSW
ncbi:MAG: phosphoadenosine phosphosulfate reductase family protein [Chloroflexota bacterium]|nr:phosphoadenosine phosphosulfate reductase family protein [Chloroflexota bacterium]